MSHFVINNRLKQEFHLRQLADRGYSPARLDEVIEILRESHRALCSFVNHANSELGENSEAYISIDEMKIISNVFSDLIDNFFAMAHTTRPLNELKIVEIEVAARIKYVVSELRGRSEALFRMAGQVHRNSDDIDEISRYLDQDLVPRLHP